MAKHTTSLFPKGWREGKADYVDLTPAIDYFNKQDAEQKQRKADLDAALKKAQEQSSAKNIKKNELNAFDTVGKVTGDVAKGVGSFIGGVGKMAGDAITDVAMKVTGQDGLTKVFEEQNKLIDNALKQGKISVTQASEAKNKIAKAAGQNATNIENVGSAVNPFSDKGLLGKKMIAENTKVIQDTGNAIRAGIDVVLNEKGNDKFDSPKDVARFIMGLPVGMLQAVLESPKDVREAVTGERLNLNEQGKFEGDTTKLTALQRFGAGGNAFINTAGMTIGGSATFLKSVFGSAGKVLSESIAKKLLKDSLVEGSEEAVQSLLTDLQEAGEFDEGTMDRMVESALLGFAGGTVFSSTGMTIDKVRQIYKTSKKVSNWKKSEGIDTNTQEAGSIVDELESMSPNEKVERWKEEEGLPKEGDELVDEIKKKQIPVESGDDIIQQIKETGGDVTENIEQTGDEIIDELKRTETKAVDDITKIMTSNKNIRTDTQYNYSNPNQEHFVLSKDGKDIATASIKDEGDVYRLESIQTLDEGKQGSGTAMLDEIKRLAYESKKPIIIYAKSIGSYGKNVSQENKVGTDKLRKWYEDREFIRYDSNEGNMIYYPDNMSDLREIEIAQFNKNYAKKEPIKITEEPKEKIDHKGSTRHFDNSRPDDKNYPKAKGATIRKNPVYVKEGDYIVDADGDIKIVTSGNVEWKGKTGYVADTNRGYIRNRYLTNKDDLLGHAEQIRLATDEEIAQAKKYESGGKPKSQKEQVAEVVATGEKTIKQIAEETNILEPNVRRILGVGAKDGTFERVGKGVYVLAKDGQDIAYVQAGDAVDSLALLAENDFKADMVFLDIPYDTPAVKGGNRGVKYDLLSVDRFDKLLGSIEKILRHVDSPVIYMYSQATSGLKAMQRYTDKMFEHGLKVIGKGEYTKLQQDGLTQVRNMRGDVIKPEGILVFNMSGVLNPNIKDLNFRLVRPKGYQTEKPAEMLKSLIEMTTEEGDVVLDPFAGSGVTGAEAIKSGRKSYNIEKNEEVVENITKPRIEEAVKEVPITKEQWRKDTMERTGFTPMQMGNLEKSLNMKFRYQDGVMSRQEAIEKDVVSFEAKEVPKYEYNRTKYNRMSQREQDEYDIKMKEKKTIYAGVHKDGSYIEIPKIVYDYYISKDKPVTAQVASEDPIAQLKQEALKYKSAEEFVKAQGQKIGIEVRDKTGIKLQDPYTSDYLPINPDGTITVYHSTTKEGAEKIKQSGIFGSKTEGGDIYFTTNKKGYGGIGKDKDVVLAFNIKPNEIKFDDIYRGELHLKGNNDDIGGIKPVEIKTKQQLTDIYNQAHTSPQVTKTPENERGIFGESISERQKQIQKDVDNGKEYNFKFNEGDQVTSDGKNYIILDKYLDNGKARYTVYPPGKKNITSELVRVYESDLLARKGSVKKISNKNFWIEKVGKQYVIMDGSDDWGGRKSGERYYSTRSNAEQRLEELNNPKIDNKIGEYELSDKDYEFARNAYYWTSFNPENSGKTDIESTKAFVEETYKRLAPIAEKNGTIDEFNDYFLKFKQKIKQSSDDVLSKKSRTSSSMITGPAKFDVRKNEARLSAENTAMQKALEIQNKGVDILEKIARNEAKPVRVGDANAVTETNKELQDLITKRDAFKEVNARVKKGEKFSDVIKDFSDELVNGNRGIKYYYEVGNGLDYETGGAIPSFALTNLNTKIKRLESKAKVATEVQGIEVAEDIIPGAKTIIDKTDNRLRVTHETKPDDSVIADMKSMGLRWSPFNKAWQAPVTPRLIYRINKYGESKGYISKEKQENFNQKFRDAIESAENPIEKPKGTPKTLGNRRYEVRYPETDELPQEIKQSVKKIQDRTGKEKLTPAQVSELNYYFGGEILWGKQKVRELIKYVGDSVFTIIKADTKDYYGSTIKDQFVATYDNNGVKFNIPLKALGFNDERIEASGIKEYDRISLRELAKDKGQIPVLRDKSSGVNYSKTSPDKYRNIVPTARSVEDLERIADQLNKAGQANAIRRHGGARSKKFAGVFKHGKNGNEHIALKDDVIKDMFNYTSVLTHEMSHAIEFMINGDTGHTLDLFGELTKEEKNQIVTELKAVTTELEGADKVAKEPSYFNKRTELLARYLQMRFLDNGKTMELAPLTTEKFDYVISEYQEVQDLMDAMNGIFDKGHWNGTPRWYRDLRQTFQWHLGKRAGDAAYYAELARRSQMQLWETEVSKMVDKKFKGIKDSQEDLFNVAEAILKTDDDGNIVFGTKDYMAINTPKDLKNAKELGYRQDKIGINENGEEYPIFSKQRYTAEEGRKMFDNLSEKGQDLIREYVAQKDEANLFNRETIKEIFKIDANIEGWVHRGLREKQKGRMLLGKNKQLRQKIAGAKKQRGLSDEHLRDFQKQTFKALVELGDAKIHNDFIMRQLARISKPIAKGQEPDEGWVEVTADFKKGLRLPGEGGRNVISISEPDNEGFMKTKRFMTPEVRYQVPIELAEHYRNMRGLPEEANKVRDVLRKVNKYWAINVLLHPGTVSTNFLSGGLQYSAKIFEDFYSEALTAQLTMPQTRRNVAAILQVLLPKNWKAAQSNVFGGVRSTFAGQFMEKSATDTALQKFGDYGLAPMGAVETYWKKVIMMSEQGHKMDKKELSEILKGLNKDETALLGLINEKVDLYGYDYENVPEWIINWGKKGGGLVKPFIKYPYKYMKMITNYAGGAFDATLPWNERAAKLMTLSTLACIALMLMNHGDDEKDTPDPTENTPAALNPRGRLWIGKDGVIDIFVRTAKYPFINLTNAAKNVAEGDWEETSNLITDQLGSLGPVMKSIMIGLGYTNTYEQYTPKDALIGQQVASFIPGFRILKDIGSVIDPYSRNPKNFQQGIGSNLPIFGDEETLSEWKGDIRSVRIPIEPETRSISKSETFTKEVTRNKNDTLLSLFTGIYLSRINTDDAKAQAKREFRNAAESQIRAYLLDGKIDKANELAKEAGFTIPEGTYRYYRNKRNKSK